MAAENAKIDNNFRKTLLGVTDDATAEIRQLKVDNATGRLLVSAVGAGITTLNGLNGSTQKFAVASTGNQFNISSTGTTHTFSLPTASATGTGQLTAANWTTFNSKLDDALSDGTIFGRKNAAWVAITAGLGDVTAAANITDNSIVRGDGGVKGVQKSSILIDDYDSITGVKDLSCGSVVTTGVVSAGSITTTGQVIATGTIRSGNAIATPYFVSTITGMGLDMTGNPWQLSGVNFQTTKDVISLGSVTAAGVVSGGSIKTTGLGSFGSIISTGTINCGNFTTSGLVSAGSVKATGTIEGGNLTTAGWLNATGTVKAGNFTTTGNLGAGLAVITSILSVGTLTVTNNISGGSITTTGLGSFGSIISTGQTTFNTTAVFDAEYSNGSVSVSGGSTINWNNGNKQFLEMDQSSIITFTAPKGPCNLILRLHQDGAGSGTITWPTVKWSGGSILSTTGYSTDIASFYYNGSSYYGMLSKAFV